MSPREANLKVGTRVKVVRGGDGWGWQAFGKVTEMDPSPVPEFRVAYDDGQLMTNPGEHEWFPVSMVGRTEVGHDYCEIKVYA